jgi:hypothetical protein
MTDAPSALPAQFSDLERFVSSWARPTRQERYDMRLSRPFDELVELYDAVAPRAEEAVEYLNGRDLTDLDEPDTTLLRLLYSLILLSYPVNVFDQARIPDSGAAFFDCVVEPSV